MRFWRDIPLIVAATGWLLTVAPQEVIAQSDMHSGNAMLGFCQATDSFFLGLCLGRLDGYLSGQEAVLGATKVICRPDVTANSQTRDIFLAELRDHPERRHARWEVLALIAYSHAWPCPDGRVITFDPATGGAVFSAPKTK